MATQAEGNLGWPQASSRPAVPLSYKLDLAGMMSALAVMLLVLLDFRRAFLFDQYPIRSPYFALHTWHLLALGAALLVLAFTYRRLKRAEAGIGPVRLGGYVKVMATIFVGLLVVDLFTYRGVAATRAVAAGKVGAGWLDAYGVTGWMRPLALGTSYLLTVWHATFLGLLIAGLALTVLPRYLMSFFTRTGVGGSLFGALFALPQPFCSCCASVIAPSFIRRGASNQFVLSFVVGSPMLNITSLILAAALLPAPYAIARVFAGVLLALPVAYGVARLAERWGSDQRNTPPGKLTQWTSRLLGRYCRVFHLEEMLSERSIDTPSAFLSTWLSVTLRIALVLIPTLFIMGVLTAAIIQVLPGAFGNNAASVLLAALAGTLLMTSTWTEIPIAQQMIQAGFSGPAATMLVVLPPVSLPCLMLLGGAMGRFRVVALLGLAVMAMGVVAGFMFL